MAHQPAIYILANKRNGTLYLGVTSNLVNRIWQHKTKVNQDFSNKYELDMLVAIKKNHFFFKMELFDPES